MLVFFYKRVAYRWVQKDGYLRFFLLKYYFYKKKDFFLVNLNEELTTWGFETTPLQTAVKNIGQFKFLGSSNWIKSLRRLYKLKLLFLKKSNKLLLL